MNLEDQYQGFSLGDARLDRRFARLRRAASKRPGESLPRLSGSEAGREAAYRFLNNRRVTFDRMIESHVKSSVERVHRERVGLVVHDSTEFKFTGDAPRPGLGRMSSGQGFMGHFALAVTADGHRAPLGIVGASTVFRDGPSLKDSPTKRPHSEREFLRWRDLIIEVEARAKHEALIHVMDREADSYEMLHVLQQRGLRFVIRLNRERLVRGIDDDEWSTTDEQMSSTQTIVTRQVALSSRTAVDGGLIPSRSDG